MPLGSIPDVIGLTGHRLDAVEFRILQGSYVRSVHVLVPDPRGLDQNFHDVTIVDMGNVPEPSVFDTGIVVASPPVATCGP